MAIEVRGLTRSFTSGTDTVEAVRGLDFTVEAGELVAFLGPNGAGKSTTVRILTTLVAPTAGTATVAGHDVVREGARARRALGYVGQKHGTGPYHRVLDELVTQGMAQRMTREAARARANELLDMLELEGTGQRLASTLSGGQRRRLDVALGLMHTPQVLFLDEPTTGLDPHSRANLWGHVRALRAASGMTVFLTTHYLDEADAMADRVMVIDKGVLIANDTPARLKAGLGGDRIRLELATEDAAARARASLDRFSTQLEGCALTITAANGDAVLPELLRSIDGVTAASLARPSLDDVFLSLTGRSLRDHAEAA